MEKNTTIAYTDEYKEELVEVEENGVKVTMKTWLTFPEAVAFVNTVVDECFNSETGEYQPEMRDVATRYAIFELYTDLRLPDSVSDGYRFTYENEELLALIMDEIDGTQFASINKAIEEKIKAFVDARSNEVARAMDRLYNSMLEFMNTLSEQFSSVDADDIKKMVSAITENGLDENKFIESYINSSKES